MMSAAESLIEDSLHCPRFLLVFSARYISNCFAEIVLLYWFPILVLR